jgi:hypothetical protein
MSYELPFDLIELVPCPALSPATSPGAPLRELAFREDSWLPDEIDRLRAMFAADESVDDIAASLDRGLHGVRSKIAELGLRRHSTRPWTETTATWRRPTARRRPARSPRYRADRSPRSTPGPVSSG